MKSRTKNPGIRWMLLPVLAVTIMSLATPNLARADMLTFNLSTVFNGATPTSTAPWLTATFTNTCGSNCVDLTLTSSLNVLSEFIDEVAFNVNPTVAPSSIGVTTDPNAPIATSIFKTTQNAQNLGGSGSAGTGFDLRILWAVTGPPSNPVRFNGSDIDTFKFTITGLTVADFNYATANGIHFGAHIQGIPLPNGGTTSGAIMETVPDGGISVMLLGGTLLGLETLRRRIRK